MKEKRRFVNLIQSTKKGTTMIEMVVSFALLSIFVSIAVVIISYITSIYYRVRGEDYARQVGDIVANKIVSEISQAKYDPKNDALNPHIYEEDVFEEDDNEKISGNSIGVCNKLGMRVRIFASKDDEILKIYYYGIVDENDNNNNIEPVYWTFDRKMYNGYDIKELEFAPANSLLNDSLTLKYNIADVDHNDYDSNVVAMYMKIKSDRYGEFNICRFIKIYELPDDASVLIE